MLDWDIFDWGVPATQEVHHGAGIFEKKGVSLLRGLGVSQLNHKFAVREVKAGAVARGLGVNQSNEGVEVAEVDARRLFSINLGGCRISSEGCFALAEVLKANSTIKELKIAPHRQSIVAEEAACSIIESMGHNASIWKLELKRMKFGEAGADAISSMIHSNSVLTELDLDESNLGRREADRIGEVLRGNTTLKRLGVGRNDLGSGGGAALVGLLEENNTLEGINLFNTSIGSDAVCKIADALRANSNIRLKELYLGSNCLEAHAFKDLSSALQVCTALKSLSLFATISRKETKECERYLAMALGSGNCSLTSLDLSGNRMTSGGLEDVMIALTKNSTVRRLNVSSNNDRMRTLECPGEGELPTKYAVACRRMLEANTTLQSINIKTSMCGEKDTAEVLRAMVKNKHLRELRASKMMRLENHLAEILIQNPRVVPLMLDEDDVLLSNAWMTLENAGVEIFSSFDMQARDASQLSIPDRKRGPAPRSNEVISNALHEIWRVKLLAFAMGCHKRLGGGQGGGTKSSPVYALSEGLVALVSHMFWGEREDRVEGEEREEF